MLIDKKSLVPKSRTAYHVSEIEFVSNDNIMLIAKKSLVPKSSTAYHVSE